MAKRKGDKGGAPRPRYPEAVKRQAMHLWAIGEYHSDDQIAAVVGVKRVRTIGEWRTAKIPEDWLEFRQRIVGKTAEKTEKKVAETLAEVTTRQLRQVRAAQTRLLQDMRTGKAATAAQTATALAKLQEEERQLMGAPGRTDEVITSELSDDELRERVRRRLAALRQAGARGTGRAGAEGAEAATPLGGDDPALPD